MKRSFLRRANAYDYQCSIFPFAPVIKVKDYQHENPSQEQVDNKKFIYVASGEPHKNHWNLLEGWLDLAKDGLKPKLTFVLDKSIYPKLHQSIEAFSQKNQLKVEIISHVPNRFMQNMYQEADALIYPSTFESFGLPLIEANAIGVPIIASELDFVRDVCQPAQTFNPHQPLSIARAVKRFLSFDGHTLIKAPQELIEYLVSN
jgi:glycosyltransferase involved in cell wall biosynthesis